MISTDGINVQREIIFTLRRKWSFECSYGVQPTIFLLVTSENNSRHLPKPGVRLIHLIAAHLRAFPRGPETAFIVLLRSTTWRERSCVKGVKATTSVYRPALVTAQSVTLGPTKYCFRDLPYSGGLQTIGALALHLGNHLSAIIPGLC